MSYTDRREYFVEYRKRNVKKFVHRAMLKELARHEGRMKRLFHKCGCEACKQGRKVAFWREADDLIIGHVEGFGDFRISNEGALILLADLQKVCGEQSEADTKRLSELRKQWQRGMPNFKTACVEFSFAVAGKIDALFAAMKEEE